jgi:hypothetical protein
VSVRLACGEKTGAERGSFCAEGEGGDKIAPIRYAA